MQKKGKNMLILAKAKYTKKNAKYASCISPPCIEAAAEQLSECHQMSGLEGGGKG